MRNSSKTCLLTLTSVLILVFVACSLPAMHFTPAHEEAEINRKQQAIFVDFVHKLDHNLYDDLGLEPTATATEIKKAYRNAGILYHPDKNPSSAAAERMRVINEAYEILSDPAKKSYYDRQIRSGLTRAPDRNRQALATAHANDASLRTALTSADTTKLEEMLSQLAAAHKPLPDTILETVVETLTNTHDKAPILAKIKLLLAHDPALYCKTVHGDTLLHLFASQGIPGGVKLYIENEQHSLKAFDIRNNTATIPLTCAVEKFVNGITNNWYKGTPNVISKEKALNYCTIIKELGLYLHQKNKTDFTGHTIKTTLFGFNYPHIAYLLHSAGVKPSEQDKQQFPILERVSPADCKIAYEPLLAFRHNGRDITLHTIYHVKQFIFLHGFECQVLLPNGTPTSVSMACLQAKDQRIVEYVLEKLTTLDPMVVVENAIRSHNSTLLQRVPFDISGKENQLLALFFQQLSYDHASLKEQTIILQTLLNHPTFHNRQATVNNMPLPHFIYELKKKKPALPDAWVDMVYACPNIDINIRHNGLTPLLHHVVLMEMEKTDDKLYTALFKRADLNIQYSYNEKTVFWYAIHNQFYDLAHLCLKHPSFHMNLWLKAPKNHPKLIHYIGIHAGYNDALETLKNTFDRMDKEYRQTHPRNPKPQQPTLPPAATVVAIDEATVLEIDEAPTESNNTTQSTVPQLRAPHPLYLFGGLTVLVLLSAAVHKFWLKQKPLPEKASPNEQEILADDSDTLSPTTVTATA